MKFEIQMLHILIIQNALVISQVLMKLILLIKNHRQIRNAFSVLFWVVPMQFAQVLLVQLGE
jgi:uncharacterized protein YebE (UPF0316 family)